ncbi:HSP20 family protein [Clostridium cavendishii DSM 21758]|uniref:HSP20 family protein n=1 Tax=Clostridium cavendishii DSM 21758 TaxID=1121302 RepID=A0A1M6TI40_9CLOT|nr:Hsp20 family protein [Clostridium cavendishii]SHK56665.1 HSP20 family protein [Clostridium cavendishii DSM 21758]
MFSMLPIYSSSLINSKEFFELIWNDVFCEKNIVLSNTLCNFKVDLKETDDSYILQADLPGLKKNEISIEYINNFLLISADRKENFSNSTTLKKERVFGEQKRMFYLDDIDINSLSSNYNLGELTIIIKKKPK